MAAVRLIKKEIGFYESPDGRYVIWNRNPGEEHLGQAWALEDKWRARRFPHDMSCYSYFDTLRQARNWIAAQPMVLRVNRKDWNRSGREAKAEIIATDDMEQVDPSYNRVSESGYRIGDNYYIVPNR